jgi:hypothetical protein
MTNDTKQVTLPAAAGVGEIISRAFRLYLNNFKEIIVICLIPTIILMLGQIPNLIFNANPRLIENDRNIALGFCCCGMPLIYSVLFVGFIISLISNIFLIKKFFGIITGNKQSIKDIYLDLKTRFSQLFFILTIVFAEAIAFYLFDVILMILFFAGVMFSFIGAGIIAKTSTILSIIFGILIFVVMMTFFIILILFICLQFLICFLQMVIFAIEKSSISECFVRSYKLVYNNATKSAIFMLCLTSLTYVITLFFDLPALVYFISEIIKTGISNVSTEGYPVHVIIIFSLWGTLVAMIFWPFIVSGITMFYYDLKVRYEGFDLLHIINNEKSKLNQDKTD